MPPQHAVLNNWEVVTLFLGTVLGSALCIMVPFWLISRSDRLTDIFAKGSPIYLRFITVILVVWSASVLAMQGRMDEGPSALFGMIVGYVFGAINKPSDPAKPPESP
jgi:type III secretory pathway component EscR